MRFFHRETGLVGLVITVAVVMGLLTDSSRAEGDNFYTDILRLENIATKIHKNYVEEMKSEELVDEAINGMLTILDPHTSYFKEKQYEELRIQTEGKFGGLGIQISIRDKILTVVTPISGTPASRAGIKSGDKIIKIEGKPTKGITLKEAVNKLRGEPGSEVTISIKRKGSSKEIDFTITREVITIKSVPYYGVIDSGTGYIRLYNFSQETGSEVEEAIDELKNRGIESLILDLRYNPGGLLPQAIDVASDFLSDRSLVVSTRGRLRRQNREFYSQSRANVPDETRVAVLVNAASASASEIVAGAVQDWDRGVIVGDTTFGKGSVQTIVPIDKEHHLKLTTAFYYTPSGRCINSEKNGIKGSKNEDESSGIETDDTSSAEKDSAAAEDRDSVRYETKSGRIVYGGGGIIPDTVILEDEFEWPLLFLHSKDLFFKFANMVYPEIKKSSVKIDSSFKVDDKLMNKFNKFLDSLDFNYESKAMIKLEEFKKEIGLVDSDSVADSSDTSVIDHEWHDKDKEAVLKLYNDIEGILEERAAEEYKEASEEIKWYIRKAILVRELGEDNPLVFRTKLAHDNLVDKTCELLKDVSAYNSLLVPEKEEK